MIVDSKNRLKHTITINPNPTDNDLMGQVMKGLRSCENGFDVRLVIAGYENDTRELNEIPEARAIANRWIKLGGLTALSTACPDGDLFDCPDAAEIGMSADTVWAFAQGFGNGQEINVLDFRDAVIVSNRFCDEHYILAGSAGSPDSENDYAIVDEETVSGLTDGQHRTKGVKV